MCLSPDLHPLAGSGVTGVSSGWHSVEGHRYLSRKGSSPSLLQSQLQMQHLHKKTIKRSQSWARTAGLQWVSPLHQVSPAFQHESRQLQCRILTETAQARAEFVSWCLMQWQTHVYHHFSKDTSTTESARVITVQCHITCRHSGYISSPLNYINP